MLSWTEALLFLRAGDEMRVNTWPKNWYVRGFSPLNSQDWPVMKRWKGAQEETYTPTSAEQQGKKWERA